MKPALVVLLALSRALMAQDILAVKAEIAKAAGEIDLLAPLTLWSTMPPVDERLDPRIQSPQMRLAMSDYPEPALKSLLNDPSARVRTLALELLFKRQDPQLLPDIYAKTTDNEPTFETIEFYDFSDNLPPKSRRMPQTVGDFAKAMAAFYGVRGDFSEYWAARKERRYWFTLLRSRMSLITGGLPTLSLGGKEKLAPFREMLNRLPGLDRDLYLIWLRSTFGEPAIATDEDLSNAVRDLGRENVLAIAEGHPPGGDPDLQPSWDPGQYRVVAGIVLDHARGVLEPPDAVRLAAVVKRERDRLKISFSPETFISTAYTIAQARLLPAQASEIVHADIGFYSGEWDGGARGQLAAVLLQLREKQELEFVGDLFYTNEQTQTALALLMPRIVQSWRIFLAIPTANI
jgi:hypothetical protein